MTVERVEVRLLALPLVEPFRAAHGTVATRDLAVLAVDTDRGRGWGECAALPQATYSGEFAADAYRHLAEVVAPTLVGSTVVSGTPVVDPRRPMAAAAVEQALLDVRLRTEGRSLAAELGVAADSRTVPAGAAVGLAPVAEVVASVDRLADEGFGRVKLKVEPGHDLDVVRAVVQAVGRAVEVQVDGNGSFGPEHVSLLIELAAVDGVTAVEQPFAPDDLDSAAELVAAAAIPVVADEAAPDLAAVEQLHRSGALSGVSIKPPRLGGLGPALAVLEACGRLGLAATAGGMIECGLGRRALVALAALDGFDLTGDLSPARRWLGADAWPDLDLSGGRARGRLAVPSTPGVAPDPDPDLLDHLTAARTVVPAA